MGSFIASIGCIALFLVAASSNEVGNVITAISGLHPLFIVLIFTLITFIFGVIGFAGLHDWNSMLRSLTTIILTFALASVIIYILIAANLFQFT